MDQHHTFDFVEGCESVDIAPDIQSYFASTDTYFNYYNASAESMSTALAQLDRYITEEGPFDGVIAFSQGGALVSTYLLDFCRRYPGIALPFRCAIFFSGTMPVSPEALKEKEFDLCIAPQDDLVIKLPTGHIWGRSDALYADEAVILASFYDGAQRETLVHDGAHEIPGARSKGDVQKCVRIIRRVIEKASVEH